MARSGSPGFAVTSSAVISASIQRSPSRGTATGSIKPFTSPQRRSPKLGSSVQCSPGHTGSQYNSPNYVGGQQRRHLPPPGYTFVVGKKVQYVGGGRFVGRVEWPDGDVLSIGDVGMVVEYDTDTSVQWPYCIHFPRAFVRLTEADLAPVGAATAHPQPPVPHPAHPPPHTPAQPGVHPQPTYATHSPRARPARGSLSPVKDHSHVNAALVDARHHLDTIHAALSRATVGPAAPAPAPVPVPATMNIPYSPRGGDERSFQEAEVTRLSQLLRDKDRSEGESRRAMEEHIRRSEALEAEVHDMRLKHAERERRCEVLETEKRRLEYAEQRVRELENEVQRLHQFPQRFEELDREHIRIKEAHDDTMRQLLERERRCEQLEAQVRSQAQSMETLAVAQAEAAQDRQHASERAQQVLELEREVHRYQQEVFGLQNETGELRQRLAEEAAYFSQRLAEKEHEFGARMTDVQRQFDERQIRSESLHLSSGMSVTVTEGKATLIEPYRGTDGTFLKRQCWWVRLPDGEERLRAPDEMQFVTNGPPRVHPVNPVVHSTHTHSPPPPFTHPQPTLMKPASPLARTSPQPPETQTTITPRAREPSMAFSPPLDAYPNFPSQPIGYSASVADSYQVSPVRNNAHGTMSPLLFPVAHPRGQLAK